MFGAQSYALAVTLMLVYGALIWLDSASLTAGTAGTAEPARRGATLAVHSTLGYLGGFIGPLAVGWVLDLGGGNAAAWSGAFAVIAAIMLLALVTSSPCARVVLPAIRAADSTERRCGMMSAHGPKRMRGATCAMSAC